MDIQAPVNRLDLQPPNPFEGASETDKTATPPENEDIPMDFIHADPLSGGDTGSSHAVASDFDSDTPGAPNVADTDIQMLSEHSNGSSEWKTGGSGVDESRSVSAHARYLGEFWLIFPTGKEEAT